MGTRRTRLSFYRRVRLALLATNNRTDSSIITECNIVRPLANDKGVPVVIKGKKRTLVQEKSAKIKRSGKSNRPVEF